MHKLFFCALTLCFISVGHTASKLNYLKVENDIVYFSTLDAKSGVRPSCVNSDNTNQWTVSLKSENGRAIYASLVTALSLKSPVEVTTANNCDLHSGFEQANSVAMTNIPDDTNQVIGKTQWVGFTNKIPGNFAQTQNKSAILQASNICHAKYPNSRVMLWDDYIDIIHDYPHDNGITIWMLDPIETFSGSYSTEYNGPNSLNELIMLKDGTTIGYTEKSYNVGASRYLYHNTFKAIFNCSEWSARTSSYKGIILQTSGKLVQGSCSNSYQLACVK